MVNEGRGLRLSHLVGVALVVGALSWMGWKVYLGTGGLLPPATWISSILLVVTAALVFAAGLPVRRFLQGRATKTLSPIRAAATVAMSRASARPCPPVHAFAFPLLRITPRISPDLRCSIDTWTGAAFTRLVVKVAADVQGVEAEWIARRDEVFPPEIDGQLDMDTGVVEDPPAEGWPEVKRPPEAEAVAS